MSHSEAIVKAAAAAIPPEEGGRGGSAWLQCFTGRRFYPLDPDPAEIDIRDIAHALAAKARYAGMTDEPFSVAQHSVLVSRAVPKEHRLIALMHDASEAYLPDVPRPLKRLPIMAAYREAEDRLMRAIAARFGFAWPEPPEVKAIDDRMIPTEARQLFRRRHPSWRDHAEPLPFRIYPQSARDAESSFLVEFEHLTGEIVPRWS